MAVALLIGLWVQKEYSYDKFLPGYQQAYQVRRNYHGNGDTVTYGGSSLKLSDALRSQIPEIEYVAETDNFGQHGLAAGETKLYLAGGQTAKDFLKIFSFPLVKGNAGHGPAGSLFHRTYQKARQKHFLAMKIQSIKPVRFDNKNNLKVTGILKDIPANSTFQFNYLVPFSYYEATTEFVQRARHRILNGTRSTIL